MVQRIGRRPPEPEVGVRFPMGAPTEKAFTCVEAFFVLFFVQDPQAVLGFREVVAAVEVDGIFCRGEEDHDFVAEVVAQLLEEGAADALVLVGFVDGEVVEVAVEAVVGHGAEETDEGVAVPDGEEDVGVVEHALDAGGVGGALGSETGAGVDAEDLVCGR